MKYIYLSCLIFFASFFNSCEDVVNVDLNAAPPKLVIDASINWEKGTSGNLQKIKLTTTSDYFSSEIPTVSGATIFIKDSKNSNYDFIENANTGEYFCTNFIPILNEEYTLTVIAKGQTYSAKETLLAIAPIDEIVQNNEGGILGNQIEIKSFYTDPKDSDNYYLYKYNYSNQIKSDYYVDEDNFFQGNTFFSLSQNEELKVGDVIEVKHFGISKRYYNYLSILLNISGNSGGGPFQSPPATVRGNIINSTDKNNFPLGYFSLSEVVTKSYTIK
jgi:hypothetical protein